MVYLHLDGVDVELSDDRGGIFFACETTLYKSGLGGGLRDKPACRCSLAKHRSKPYALTERVELRDVEISAD
jgi:hypothetical protein